MGKVKGKHRLDKYYHLAKEHGYRSRASWKLVQLDAKYSFLRSARSVLDLCAAPGGWMQVAVQRVPVGSLVVGLDLVPIAPIRGAAAMQQDITKPECKVKVKRLMADSGVSVFDLVLHDGSPNVGGAWAQEAMSQNALVIDAVRLATQLLAPKGTFITKVFRSQDYESVKFCLTKLFEKVEVHKPAASRSTSAETYLLAFKYKAPAKIDPRLLDVKHLFQGAIEPVRKVVDVLKPNKQKRFREGYEEGVTTLRKVAAAADFIWSESPLDILGSVTSISFDDPASLPIQENALTTEEVKILCDDLRVLGKQDFKHLLKWRMHIRKALTPAEKAEPAAPAEETEAENKENEDDKLLNEMEELTLAMEQKQKRKKKILAKRKAKDKVRKATGPQVDAVDESYVDHELFSLSAIKGKKDLSAVDTTVFDEEIRYAGDNEHEDRHEKANDDSSSDADSDEERKRYDEQIEQFMDEAYERYMSKREGSSKQRKRAKKLHSEQDTLEGGEDEEMVQSDNDSDKDQALQEANPLMIPLNEGFGPTPQEMEANWYNQGIFAEAVEAGDLHNDSDSEDEKPQKPQKAKKPKTPTDNKISIEKPKPKASKAEPDFEIVPAPQSDSSDSSSSDESDLDVDKKAEILACAKKMLNKKTRNNLLDDAYNKYMFDDEGLPNWFLEEEKRHRVPVKPITREEINAMKAQFKEIDARPAKKVAEAKARKKRNAAKRLEKVRKKANVISDIPDISDRSKRKQIEVLYKKAEPKRPGKEFVVAKKGVQVRVGPGKKLVDQRMKKDLRGQKKGGNKKGKMGKGRVPKGKDVKSPGKGRAPKGRDGKSPAGKGSNRGKMGRK